MVFVATGWLAARAVLHHAASGGAFEPQVRLAAAMAGLFAGGIAATLVLLAITLRRGS
jgi:hypothetical protein